MNLGCVYMVIIGRLNPTFVGPFPFAMDWARSIDFPKAPIHSVISPYKIIMSKTLFYNSTK